MSNHQQRGPGPAPDQGVYGISVAAGLCGAPIQSIRLWERHGLLTPARTQGGTRRYSAEEVTLIARIAALAAAGVNIAGITRILDLEDANTALRTAGSSRR
jgi:MerR family transcriptional regulator/heat shock protein HspR